jgi:MFS family permease
MRAAESVERAAGGRAGLLAALALLVLITVATNTTASLAQPRIGQAFDVGPAETAWVVFGYSATFAVATALFGGIASHVGLVRALVGGVSLLGVGSIAAALAPSLEILIASRLLQGLGSGAIPTLATSIIARRFEGAERARAIGVVVAAVGAGQAAGPLLGGLLLQTLGWRAAVSIGVIALPAVAILARSQRGRGEAPDQPGRIDWLGAGLVAVVALGASFLLNRLPLVGLVPLTAVPLAIFVAAALILWGRTVRIPAGFLPRSVVLDPTFQRVVGLAAVGMSAYLGSIVLVPILGARLYGLDGIVLGLLLLPMALAAAISSPNNARVQATIGRRATTRISLGATGLGALGLALGALGGGLVVILLALTALGIGFGLLSAPLLNELTHAFAEAHQPVAVGVFNLCFFLAGGVGAAISSAIVQAGLELPFLAGSRLPGFATAEVLLAIAPLALAAMVLRAPQPR